MHRTHITLLYCHTSAITTFFPSFAVPQQVLVSQLGSAVATCGSAQVVGAAGTAVAAPPPPTAVMQSMPIALTTVAAAAAAGNGLQQQLQTVQPQQIQQIQQVCSLAKIK